MTARFVTFLVSHTAAGGVQEIWGDLADGFARRGYVVRLVALYRHAETNPRPAGLLPWTFVADRKPDTVTQYARLLRKLVADFRENPPDIVFTAMPAANVIAPVAVRLAGAQTRVIISHHTPVDTYRRLLNAVDNVTGAFRNVSHVVAVSKAVVSSLDDKPARYRAKCLVIPNALPPPVEAKLQVLSRRRSRSQANDRVVVSIGRLADQKNYPVLIRAATLMPDVEIRIIGGGPLEARLKAQVDALGVESRVHFLGQLSREEALDQLAKTDVFAQPSLFEGHSLALIEAAKLHLPLVVSDVPVQIEGITAADGIRCGIAVPSGDEIDWAHQLCLLLDDPDQYRDASQKASHLASEATYTTMIERYMNLT